jgi:hypothetical protein
MVGFGETEPYRRQDRVSRRRVTIQKIWITIQKRKRFFSATNVIFEAAVCRRHDGACVD